MSSYELAWLISIQTRAVVNIICWFLLWVSVRERLIGSLQVLMLKLKPRVGVTRITGEAAECTYFMRMGVYLLC